MSKDLINTISKIIPLPTLKDFYDSFSSDHRGTGDPTFTLAQNNKFFIMMFPNDFLPNPLESLAVKTLSLPIIKQLTSFNIGSALTLSFLGMLAQSVKIPDLSTQDGDYPTPADKGLTDFGYMNFPGKFMIPETNELTISFLDTEFSPCDTFFAQWLSQTTGTEWAYVDKPYMVSSIIVAPITQSPELHVATGGVSDGVNLPRQMYVFLRCFPTKVAAPQFDVNSEPSDANQRDVVFRFSKFFIFPNVLGYIQSGMSSISSIV